MVRLVRSHKSMHLVASQFRVSVNVVARWVERAAGHRLDKVTAHSLLCVACREPADQPLLHEISYQRELERFYGSI